MVVIRLRPLGGRADQDDGTAGTGNGTLDDEQTLVGVHGVDREVLGGLAHAAHATGHAQTLEDAARGGAATDRARLAVVAVRTVGGRDALEAVTLHDAGEALALGGAGDVDGRAGLEGRDGDLLADGVLGGIAGAELDEVAARRHTGLLEVAGHGLVDLARVDRAEGDLDGVVAIRLGVADLRDDAGARLDDGHGDEAVVRVPDLGHAELLAKDALDVALDSSVSHVGFLRA